MAGCLSLARALSLGHRGTKTRSYIDTSEMSAAIACHFEALEPRLLLSTVLVNADAADGSADSLRAAITAANSNGEDDVIELAAGTYTLGLPGWNEDANATGDFDLTEAGHTITLRGTGVIGEIEVTPPMVLDFGKLDAGMAATLPVTIKNVGRGPLNVTPAADLRDEKPAFEFFANPTPVELAADQEVIIQITFTAGEGDFTGFLDIWFGTRLTTCCWAGHRAAGTSSSPAIARARSMPGPCL